FIGQNFFKRRDENGLDGMMVDLMCNFTPQTLLEVRSCFQALKKVKNKKRNMARTALMMMRTLKITLTSQMAKKSASATKGTSKLGGIKPAATVASETQLKAAIKAAASPKTPTTTPSPISTVHTFTFALLALALGASWLYTRMLSPTFPPSKPDMSVARSRALSNGLSPLLSTSYIEPTFWALPCVGEMHPHVDGCTPSKNCGRYVEDGVLSAGEVQRLVAISERGMKAGRQRGGPMIFDLASGAVTYEDRFVSVYKALDKDDGAFLSSEEWGFMYGVYEKIRGRVVTAFGIEEAGKLALSTPSFFSRIGSQEAKTAHDVYTDAHVDREQYGSFCYTGLVYLTTKGEEFEGGNFVWLDDDEELEDGARLILEPRAGRLSLFSSGHENVHKGPYYVICQSFFQSLTFTPQKVELVTSGTRRALTVAFTCEELAQAGSAINSTLKAAWSV
ncbi:2-oxoglutarate and iron-dependent oxygenase domain-containing protein 3, partial [Irineochytrium annulatum]